MIVWIVIAELCAPTSYIPFNCCADMFEGFRVAYNCSKSAPVEACF